MGVLVMSIDRGCCSSSRRDVHDVNVNREGDWRRLKFKREGKGEGGKGKGEGLSRECVEKE